MIKKAALTLVHPFIFNPELVRGLEPGNIVSPEERDDFLPYVRNFIEKSTPGHAPRAVSLERQRLELHKGEKKDAKPDQLPVGEGKVFFFPEGIGILTLHFTFGAIEEQEYSKIQRALTGLSKVNAFRIVPCDPAGVAGNSPDLTVSDWLTGLVSPWCAQFNPLARSHVAAYSILFVGREQAVPPAFIEALLHNRIYQADPNLSQETHLADSVRSVRHSGQIQVFGTTSGTLYICRDDGSEFMRNNVFDLFGRNYLFTFIITVFQQVRLQQLIDDASDLFVTRHISKQVKTLKESILTYLAQSDFTQLSNNPSRNLLYKFFRTNFEIRDLLDEASTIVKKIDQEIEAEKAEKVERIAILLEVLILPYYLHHILEMVLEPFVEDEQQVSTYAFSGTIVATLLVIFLVRSLLRGVKK